MNQQTETIIYHYALANPELALKIKPDFFDAKYLRELFEIGRDYSIKYHGAPTADQMKQLVTIAGKQDKLPPDVIDIIYAQKRDMSQYDETWLYDTTTAWAQWENFTAAVIDSVQFVKLHNDEITAENVREYTEKAKGTFNRNAIMEFGEQDNGSDFYDAAAHRPSQLVHSPTGIDYIDKCLAGGGWSGALIGFAGAPKIGKSMWLQNLCAASVRAGQDSLYISLELPEEMIIQRIGANLLGIPSGDYSKMAEDEQYMKDRIRQFRESNLIPPGRLVVKSFPTSTLTSIELEAFVLKLEEEFSTPDKPFKFKNLYLDYINIMKNYRNPNSENTYMKIKCLAEDVKAVAIKNGWCVYTATQTNRGQFDQTDMTANQISESAGFGATVDALFGIIADQIQKSQGIYFLKCLYDRVNPMDNTRPQFNFDKRHPRITEDMESQIEDAEDIYRSVTVPGFNENMRRGGGPGSERQWNEHRERAVSAPVAPSFGDSAPLALDTGRNGSDLTQTADDFDAQGPAAAVFGQAPPIYTGAGLF